MNTIGTPGSSHSASPALSPSRLRSPARLLQENNDPTGVGERQGDRSSMSIDSCVSDIAASDSRSPSPRQAAPAPTASANAAPLLGSRNLSQAFSLAADGESHSSALSPASAPVSGFAIAARTSSTATAGSSATIPCAALPSSAVSSTAVSSSASSSASSSTTVSCRSPVPAATSAAVAPIVAASPDAPGPGATEPVFSANRTIDVHTFIDLADRLKASCRDRIAMFHPELANAMAIHEKADDLQNKIGESSTHWRSHPALAAADVAQIVKKLEDLRSASALPAFRLDTEAENGHLDFERHVERELKVLDDIKKALERRHGAKMNAAASETVSPAPASLFSTANRAASPSRDSGKKNKRDKLLRSPLHLLSPRRKKKTASPSPLSPSSPRSPQLVQPIRFAHAESGFSSREHSEDGLSSSTGDSGGPWSFSPRSARRRKGGTPSSRKTSAANTPGNPGVHKVDFTHSIEIPAPATPPSSLSPLSMPARSGPGGSGNSALSSPAPRGASTVATRSSTSTTMSTPAAWATMATVSLPLTASPGTPGTPRPANAATLTPTMTPLPQRLGVYLGQARMRHAAAPGDARATGNVPAPNARDKADLSGAPVDTGIADTARVPASSPVGGAIVLPDTPASPGGMKRVAPDRPRDERSGKAPRSAGVVSPGALKPETARIDRATPIAAAPAPPFLSALPAAPDVSVAFLGSIAPEAPEAPVAPVGSIAPGVPVAPAGSIAPGVPVAPAGSVATVGSIAPHVSVAPVRPVATSFPFAPAVPVPAVDAPAVSIALDAAAIDPLPFETSARNAASSDVVTGAGHQTGRKS